MMQFDYFLLFLTAACYDPRNLCVWTTNDDWVDLWNCAGKVKVSSHHLDARLGPLEPNEATALEQNGDTPQTLRVSSAISILLRHIGVESCRLVPGLEFSTVVPHALPLSFMSQCCDLLESSVHVASWGNVQAVIVTLQVSETILLECSKMCAPVLMYVQYNCSFEWVFNTSSAWFASFLFNQLRMSICHVRIQRVESSSLLQRFQLIFCPPMNSVYSYLPL